MVHREHKRVLPKLPGSTSGFNAAALAYVCMNFSAGEGRGWKLLGFAVISRDIMIFVLKYLHLSYDSP